MYSEVEEILHKAEASFVQKSEDTRLELFTLWRSEHQTKVRLGSVDHRKLLRVFKQGECGVTFRMQCFDSIKQCVGWIT